MNRNESIMIKEQLYTRSLDYEEWTLIARPLSLVRSGKYITIG